MQNQESNSLIVSTEPTTPSAHSKKNILKTSLYNITISSPDIALIVALIENLRKLTPNDDSPAYSQSLPTPINLRDDITVELALLHRYGIITTLPFSKYASPIFAQRKPNGRLRLLVDLRKINNLISQDYVNNNHPVSTLLDAAQHMAGKKFFCKLNCSQANHCLQMAENQSMQMLAFNFETRTFAYRRLA